jgi:hypothetical protein
VLKDFPVFPDLQTGSGANSAFIELVPRLRREADHIRLSTAEVKHEWSYTFTPPYTYTGKLYLSHRTFLTTSLYEDDVEFTIFQNKQLTVQEQNL